MPARKVVYPPMTSTESTPGKPPTLPAVATWISVGSLLALLVFLAIVAWQKGGVDLSGIAPALVTGLLGAVVNPPADKSEPPLKGFGQMVWVILVLVAGVVSVMTGALTLFSSSHPGAAGAFAASVGGLAGLLVDTSDFTVVQKILRKQPHSEGKTQ
jgi:hypothetical protein